MKVRIDVTCSREGEGEARRGSGEGLTWWSSG